MNLRMRLALLMVLLTALPALLAVFLTRQLIDRSLDLGLSSDVDNALQAGVEEARTNLDAQRHQLQSRAASLAAAWPGPGAPAGSAVVALRRQQAALSSEQAFDGRIVLQDPQGREFVVQEGERTSPAETDDGAPPRFVSAHHELDSAWSLQLESAVTPQWFRNATQLAETLQLVRGLRVQQKDLERSFWLPFLMIYGVSILIALLLALRIGRGITVPVNKLLTATDAVAAGNWQVQVPTQSRDEIGRLTRSFNGMVHTLDAQSQRLVDLEKMAGWREMARALAHEIKNPLTPIQLTVEEMRERYTGDDDEYRQLLSECARIVVEEVESLRGVVNRFREFSRPVALEPEPVRLNQLIQDVAALQRDLSVELQLDEAIGVVEIDADRMRQVFMNLTENARQATSQTEAPAIRMTSRQTTNEIEILVEDNGPGIAASERQRVFEPYRSGTSGGLGLGLALVRGILLAHGGDIVAEQGSWGGACFRLRLPLHSQQQERTRNSKNDRTPVESGRST